MTQPEPSASFLESILRCPASRQKLTLADAALLSAVNAAIAQGKVKNLGGDVRKTPLTAALVRDDRQLLYPIEDGLPTLLKDEAIPLQPIDSAGPPE